MKVKTTELQGEALDWAVAKIQGDFVESCNFTQKENLLRFFEHYHKLNYSSDWAQGGSIIEREDISIIRLEDEYVIDSKGFWTNKRIPVFGAVIGRCFDLDTLRNSYGDDCGSAYCIEPEHVVTGPAPLIAAMRCYVLSKLGEYVDIPEELNC